MRIISFQNILLFIFFLSIAFAASHDPGEEDCGGGDAGSNVGKNCQPPTTTEKPPTTESAEERKETDADLTSTNSPKTTERANEEKHVTTEKDLSKTTTTSGTFSITAPDNSTTVDKISSSMTSKTPRLNDGQPGTPDKNIKEISSTSTGSLVVKTKPSKSKTTASIISTSSTSVSSSEMSGGESSSTLPIFASSTVAPTSTTSEAALLTSSSSSVPSSTTISSSATSSAERTSSSAESSSPAESTIAQTSYSTSMASISEGISHTTSPQSTSRTTDSDWLNLPDGGTVVIDDITIYMCPEVSPSTTVSPATTIMVSNEDVTTSGSMSTSGGISSSSSIKTFTSTGSSSSVDDSTRTTFTMTSEKPETTTTEKIDVTPVENDDSNDGSSSNSIPSSSSISPTLSVTSSISEKSSTEISLSTSSIGLISSVITSTSEKTSTGSSPTSVPPPIPTEVHTTTSSKLASTPSTSSTEKTVSTTSDSVAHTSSSAGTTSEPSTSKKSTSASVSSTSSRSEVTSSPSLSTSMKIELSTSEKTKTNFASFSSSKNTPTTGITLVSSGAQLTTSSLKMSDETTTTPNSSEEKVQSSSKTYAQFETTTSVVPKTSSGTTSSKKASGVTTTLKSSSLSPQHPMVSETKTTPGAISQSSTTAMATSAENDGAQISTKSTVKKPKKSTLSHDKSALSGNSSTMFQKTTFPTSTTKEDQTEKVKSSSKTTEYGPKVTTGSINDQMTSSTASSALQTKKMTTESVVKTTSEQSGPSTTSTEKKSSTTSGSVAQTSSSEGSTISTTTPEKDLQTFSNAVSLTAKPTNFQKATSPTSPAEEYQTEIVTSSSRTTENEQRVTTGSPNDKMTSLTASSALQTEKMTTESIVKTTSGQSGPSTTLTEKKAFTTSDSVAQTVSSKGTTVSTTTPEKDLQTSTKAVSSTAKPTNFQKATSPTSPAEEYQTEIVTSNSRTTENVQPKVTTATSEKFPQLSTKTVSSTAKSINGSSTTSAMKGSTSHQAMTPDEKTTSGQSGPSTTSTEKKASTTSSYVAQTGSSEGRTVSTTKPNGSTESNSMTTDLPTSEKPTTPETIGKSTNEMISKKKDDEEPRTSTEATETPITYSNVSDALFATKSPESSSPSQNVTPSKSGTTVSLLDEHTTSGTIKKSTEQMPSRKVGVTEDASHTTYSNVSDAPSETSSPESSSPSQDTTPSKSAASSQTVLSDPVLTTKVPSAVTPQSSSRPSGSSSSTRTTSRPSSSSTASHQKSTAYSTPSSVKKASSIPTTENPLCSQQCPTGYLIGTSYCFKLAAASARINSYQSALSHCKTVDRQTLASLDKIKETADIKMIQESAGLQNIDWVYSNGIGGKKERFEKVADVYSVFAQKLVSSPILMTVGISEKFGNISALCVLPKYCNPNECDVQKLFLAYDYYSRFKESAGILLPQKSGTVSCLYGNQKTATVTCNDLGAIYPNPSLIDCEEEATERTIRDTTNETVSSCKVCFGRGTKECQAVIDSSGNVEGYRCVCREPYMMASCWRTMNLCNSTVCGKNGVCRSELDQMICDCEWGYTGDRCEIELKKKYNGDIGYSSAVGATITLGGWIFRAIKLMILGFSMKTDQCEDPQDTHQSLRSYCMTGAGIILTLWSNPTILGIDLAACRFYFIGIHFFYIMAMTQWVLEGFNVNQVLRCVHSNEWEVNRNGRNSGVRVIPRLAVPAVVVAVWLLVPFQYGWNQLAAEWTCAGVFCEQTLNVWIPIFALVLFLTLLAGGIYETSRLIKSRRPLLAYQIELMVERDLGQRLGQRVQKCRKNDTNCLIGLLLLIALWLSVIVSSDHRDEKIYGIITVVCAGIYSAFCTYQEIVTSPEDYAQVITLLQRWAPGRFAPDYNPMTMWTIDEVQELYKLPKIEREEAYKGLLTFNQKLYLHHKWDVRLNEILAENPEIKIDGKKGALAKVLSEEVNHLIEHNGTYTQLEEVMEAHAAYCDSVPHVNPRDAGIVNGRLELVTLAADHPQDGIRLAKFFIVPGFHTFEPVIPKRGESRQRREQRKHERQLMTNLKQGIYELGRDEAIAQNKFINSSILFCNYGNHVVR